MTGCTNEVLTTGCSRSTSKTAEDAGSDEWIEELPTPRKEENE